MSVMLRELFSIRGEPFGFRFIQEDPHAIGGRDRVVHSSVLFCPRCGDCWARRTMLPPAGTSLTTRWATVSAVCDHCGDGRVLSVGGGSPDLHNPDLAQYPMQLLLRELAIYAGLFQNPTMQYYGLGFLPRIY